MLTIINTGLFKLDGGAMFGVVPQSMWKKLNPPDENNMCTWAMRCMLVQQNGRNILIDTGMGSKQDEKFRSHFYPHGEDSLVQSLAALGLAPEDITDVFHTHLHFDHCGGSVMKTADGQLLPQFPNARYWTNQRHYDWAYKPNARERASFLKENFVPLQEQGVLQMVPMEGDQRLSIQPFELFDLFFVYGHTEAMMLPVIHTGEKTVVYAADLIPSEHHVGMPYVMSYDLRPLETMQEKAFLLERAAAEGWILVFEHAPNTEAATVTRQPDGRITIDKVGPLADLLSA